MCSLAVLCAPMLAPIVLAVALVAIPVERADRHVIPPGREALLSEMLKSDPPTDACALTSVSIRADRVVAEYSCPGTPRAVLELREPGGAEPTRRTEQFAVFAVTDGFPQGLLDGLVARIRAREHAWRWASPGLPVEGAERSPVFELALLLTLAAVALHTALDRAHAGPAPPVQPGAGLRVGEIARSAPVFVAALLLLEVLVPDPPLHLDTSRDLLVARDLLAGHGVMPAVPSSFEHARLFHGGPWLRALEAALALDVPLRGVRLAVHVLQALSIGLVHWAARRETGAATAAVAAVLQTSMVVAVVEAPVLWNVSLVPLPLAVLGIALLACTRTGRLAPVLWASAALGIAAQLHVVAAALLPLVVAVVVAAARRPAIALLAMLGASCAAFTVGAWPAAAADFRAAAAYPAVVAIPAAAAAAGWMVRRHLSRQAPERRVQAVLLALAITSLLPVVVGAYVRHLEPRYGILCLAMAPFASCVLGASAATSRSTRLLGTRVVQLGATVVVAVALWICARNGEWKGRSRTNTPRWTLYDAEALATALHPEGCSFGYLFRHLRTLDRPRALLASIASLDPDSTALPPPDRTEDDLVLLKSPGMAALNPGPGWVVTPLRGDFVAIAVRVPASLRFDRFEWCVAPLEPACRTISPTPPEPTSFSALAYPNLEGPAKELRLPRGAVHIRITTEVDALDGASPTLITLPRGSGRPQWHVQLAGGGPPAEVLSLDSRAGRGRVVFALDAPEGLAPHIDDLWWIPPYVETPRDDEQLTALLADWRPGEAAP